MFGSRYSSLSSSPHLIYDSTLTADHISIERNHLALRASSSKLNIASMLGFDLSFVHGLSLRSECLAAYINRGKISHQGLCSHTKFYEIAEETFNSPRLDNHWAKHYCLLTAHQARSATWQQNSCLKNQAPVQSSAQRSRYILGCISRVQGATSFGEYIALAQESGSYWAWPGFKGRWLHRGLIPMFWGSSLAQARWLSTSSCWPHRGPWLESQLIEKLTRKKNNNNGY